jgi:hypothetical protein
VVLIELQGATDFLGNVSTFYLSTDPFVTKPSDTPANTHFQPVIMDPGSYGLHTFSDGKTGGSTELDTGEVVLSNVDGRFDVWKDYSFDGRSITIRSGDPSSSYPGSTYVVFSGTMESVDVTWSRAIIRLKDRQFIFEKTVLQNYFGGTNSLPNGVDGTVDDLKSQKKPKVFGRVLNIAPPCVNTSLLIYQPSDGTLQSVDAVYDNGLAITAGADYATNALLQAATGLTASTYVTCKAEGMIRLASSPAGVVTCDVSQGTTSAKRTAAQLLKVLALEAGASSVSASDVTAMDAANSAELGVWVTDNMSFVDVMDIIANSVGAAYYFDNLGELRMAILTIASSPEALAVPEHYVLDLERITARDNNVPPFSITLNHTKNNNVMTTGVAGAVTIARRAFLAEPFRSSIAVDASVKNKYLLAKELVRDTAIVDTANIAGGPAAVEATRVLNLYKTGPNIYEITVPLDIIQGTFLPLLSVILLTNSRFGMASGRYFRLIGLDMELSTNKAMLTVWG